MKYLLMIYVDPAELQEMPEQEFNTRMAGCLAHADELRCAGRLLDAQMLQGAKAARSVRVRGGRQMVTDGPFTETKELLAGFNLVEADDMDEAVRMALEFPWAETGCIEVRPVIDMGVVRDQVLHANRTVIRPGV